VVWAASWMVNASMVFGHSSETLTQLCQGSTMG
jgi:hypothetical protein